MIWNETIECASREEMRKLQSARLQKLVTRVYYNCEPYRKRMQEAGITPSDIQSIDDIVKLPPDFDNATPMRILNFSKGCQSVIFQNDSYPPTRI